MLRHWQKIIWSIVVVVWVTLICLGGWFADSYTVVAITLAGMNTILLAYIWYINTRSLKPVSNEDQEKKRMVTNLAIAEKIQKQLLPTKIPVMDGLECCVRSRPSEEIGGDFYQILEPDSDHVIFAMGDVAGHGLPSGMISIMIDTMLHAFNNRSLSLVDELVEMNKVLYKRIDPSLFASMILCSWEKSTQKLMVASAGFGYLLHWDAQKKQVNKIKGGGMALGMIADIRPFLEEKEIVLNLNDSLVVATDGISEILNEDGQRLGVKGVAQWIAQAADGASAQTLFDALSRVIAQSVHTKTHDDLTLMVLNRCLC